MLHRGLRVIFLFQSLAWVACGVAETWSRLFLHLHGVYVWPLFPDRSFLLDFRLLSFRFSQLHSASFFQGKGMVFTYPPGAAIIYAIFYRMPLWTYVFSVAFAFCVAAAITSRGLVKRGLPGRLGVLFAIIGIISAYPFWFAFQRGNIEVFVWGASALGLWAFYRRRGYSAAACFALAGTMKIYPLIYMALLISRRQWKQLAFGAACTGGLTVLSLWLLCPDIRYAARQSQADVAAFALLTRSTIDRIPLSFDHSLFGLFKFLQRSRPSRVLAFSTLFGPACALGGIALYWFRIRKLSEDLQVTAIVCATLVLTYVSFDYTLLHLYSALGFLIFAAWDRGEAPDRRLIALVALCVSPMTEVIWHGYTLEGQLKAVLISAALLLAASKSPDAILDTAQIV